MARAIWRGVISFGMVSIPVRLFTATESKDISFRQLHEETHTPVKQLRWSPELDREVAYDELIKGYEYAKGQYVIVDDEDFDKLPVPSKHTIDLTAFVANEEIDPIHYERSYYLEPDEAGQKPFALLLRSLEEKGLLALGKVALRQKEHLCVLRPHDGIILLETLYYPDEIREPDGSVDVEGIQLTDQEMQMAAALIDMLRKPFDPSEYKDAYREKLIAMISAKLEGGEIVTTEQDAPAAASVYLMAALKASVDAAKARKAEAPSANGASEDGDSTAEEPKAKRTRKKAAAKS
ncbi:MAG: Ku protein [Chloroflexi bacterium]|nr:Ku protein [Chloroflexota bacterium]MQC82466.1 Ku protein [Chloroflexota bacterium]